MDALGIDAAHLSGESLGGWVAAWTAAHHPDRVRRLVLNTPGNIANKPEVMARLRDTHAGRGAGPERRHRAPPGGVPVPPHGDGHRRAGEPAPRRLHPAGLRAGDPQHARAAGPAGAQGLRVGAGLGRQDRPRPRCCCGPSTTPPAASTRRTCCCGWLPDARLHVIADAGHWPQWEKVDEYLRVHREFLLRQDVVDRMSEICRVRRDVALAVRDDDPARRGVRPGRGASSPTSARVADAVAAPGPRRGRRARTRPLPRQLLRRDAAVRARRRGGGGVRRLRHPLGPAAGRRRPGLVDPRRARGRRASTCRCRTRSPSTTASCRPTTCSPAARPSRSSRS